MRTYQKPEMQVEIFEMSHSVASCAITSYNKPVTVDCVITQSETVYQTAGSNGCDYSITSGVSFDGGYFKSAHDVVDQFSDDGNITSDEYSTKKTDNRQYYLEAGTYLVWYGHGNYHVGPIPSSELEIIQNHS